MKPARLLELFDAFVTVATGAVAYVTFAAGFLACLAILGWQCLTYLKVGAWPSLSALDVAIRLVPESSSDWLLAPDKWIGVHNIMGALPASVTVWLVGLAVGGMALHAHESLKK